MTFSAHDRGRAGTLKQVATVVGKALILGFAYFLAGRLGLMLAPPHLAISLIWLPTGIATAGLLRWGLSYWPALLLTTTILQEFSFSVTWPLAGFIVAGQTLAPMAVAWMLRRAEFHFSFDRRRDIFLFALLTGFGMMITPSMGATTLCIAGKAPWSEFGSSWLYWWLGDWMGVLVAGPLLVSMSRESWLRIQERSREFLIWFALSTGVMGTIFFVASTPSNLPLIFIPLCLTVWAAMRLGVTGTSVGVLALAAIAASGTAASRGPFLHAGSYQSIFLLWAYLITATVFNLMVTGIEISRINARRELLDSKFRLQKANEELAAAALQAKKLAVEASAANHAKGAFLSNMSHEIRTPLNGVIGMADLLINSPLTEEQRAYAKVAHDCGESLLRLINDILDFSKIEAGRFRLSASSFDLQEVLGQTVAILAPSRPEKIRLTCEVKPGTPTRLFGDPGRLGQVLLNLVHNAIKFTEQGEVSISVGLDRIENNTPTGPVTLRFEIEDTGPGISSDWIEQLFQPFVQVDSSPARRFGGTGLGLAISKELAELMGGTIGVSSLEGRGSLFWFTAVFNQNRETATNDASGLEPLEPLEPVAG